MVDGTRKKKNEERAKKKNYHTYFSMTYSYHKVTIV